MPNIFDDRPWDPFYAIAFLGMGLADVRLAITAPFQAPYFSFFNALCVGIFNFIAAYFFAFRHKAQQVASLGQSIVGVISFFLPSLVYWLSTVVPSNSNLQVLGLGFMVVGVVVIPIALGSLGKSFAVIPARREIVTKGIYRFIRHPMYFGEILMGIGVLLAYFNAVNLAITLGSVLTLLLRIRWEEGLLSQSPDYVLYKARVKYRFIPFIW
ncbi:MAG TPA: isoprenylcysteine carboxylmethyltransferase family protein [Candidatus Lokiarchaeia archaeon]|nr:isoprenylcysteine carboxylmethyltransferase family protein [Candidatus Lokiarchaeia archaeon]